ncbi:hypothetical protein Droror1_Dr00011676 [Drosera rotundifolia]
MGSCTSRPRSHTAGAGAGRGVSSLLCGGGASTSREPEDYPAESLVNSAECCDPVVVKCEGPVKEFVPSSFGGSGSTSSEIEIGVSPSTSDSSIEQPFKGCYPHSLDASCGGPSVNVESYISSSDIDNGSFAQTIDGDDNWSSSVPQENEIIQARILPSDESVDVPGGIPASDSIPSPHLLDAGTCFQPVEVDSTPSGIAANVSDSVQDLREGNSYDFNRVSISSVNLAGGNEEGSVARDARRHGRRMFWDSFSSRSSRRRSEFSTMLLATEEMDSVGPRRRWLIDFSGDLDGGIGGDSWHFSRRSHIGSERWWRSRSQLLDRLRGGTGESGHQTTCPLGLHPDGSCSCDLDEDNGTRASISRVVLLAEALFEVLDEIHRQPSSFSLSMVSRPAPESVVDSFPIRFYHKYNAAASEEDVEQCYICLAEYEDNDKIRTLACHHEYHMSCVDKWLKEIHGVCPLCRGDVCEKSGVVADSDVSTPPLDHP